MSHIGRSPCDEALVRTGPQAISCPPSRQPWVLAAAIGGSSMAFIDGTVVNVALPAIQRDLHATAFEAQWVVEAYALFLAALLLVGGSLGDRFGRRKVFVIGVGIFVGASIFCALSANVRNLVVARGLQGVGAALLVPGSLALISASFPESERGQAIGTWSGFSGITAALGPLLGGFLVDHYSWAWAFLINLPLGIVVLVVALWRVPESHSHGGDAGGGIDVWGALLATSGLAGVVYALIEAAGSGWRSYHVVVALAVGVVALGLFVAVEARSSAPMLPLSLFRVRNFAGANLLTLLLYAALGGGMFFLPLNLIQVQGYSSTAAGGAFLPLILIMFALSRWAGQLVDRVGSKLPLVIGPVVAAAGFAWFAVPGIGGSYWLTFFPAVVVLGLGMTVTVAPLTTTVMNAVEPDRAGIASGVNNAVSRTAALLAIASFGIVMARAFETSLRTQLAALHVEHDVAAFMWEQRGQLAGASVPDYVNADTAVRLTAAVKHAFVVGYRWVMLLCAALALLSAVSAWVLIDARPRVARDPA